MKAKNVFLVVLCVVLMSPAFAAAEVQTPKEAQNAISIDLLMPVLELVDFLGGWPMMAVPVSIQYQRVISDHLVLSI